MRLRISRTWVSAASRRPKRLLSAVQVVASRAKASRAVSWQRHQGLDRISPMGAWRAKRFAEPLRFGAPLIRKIALRRAVLQPETRRIADARRRGGVADEQHVSAALDQLPCVLVGARGLRQEQHHQRDRHHGDQGRDHRAGRRFGFEQLVALRQYESGCA
jgi:hypothetical protein